MGAPQWPKRARIESFSKIAARIRIRPEHFGHTRTSTRNTRFNSSAHGVHRPRRGTVAGVESWSLGEETTTGVSGGWATGTTMALHPAAGASTPCYAEPMVMRSSSVPELRQSRFLRAERPVTPHNIKRRCHPRAEVEGVLLGIRDAMRRSGGRKRPGRSRRGTPDSMASIFSVGSACK